MILLLFDLYLSFFGDFGAEYIGVLFFQLRLFLLYHLHLDHVSLLSLSLNDLLLDLI